MENIEINCHSSIKISFLGKNIYIDPYQISKDQKDADFLFITHDHYDHFSEEDILKVIMGKPLSSYQRVVFLK